MDYEAFIAEVKKYWDLRSKGLKKQGNRFLFQFTEKFKREVPEGEADEILFQFCREYIDEQKFPGDHLPRRHLPFQLTELLNSYFNRECAKNKMPQMRWAFQIFGEYYNPHETGEEDKLYITTAGDKRISRLYSPAFAFFRSFSSISFSLFSSSAWS